MNEVNRVIRAAGALLTITTIALAASSAAATVFQIDEFSVELNGQLMFQDTFSDGTPPPNGPQFNIGNPAPNLNNIYNTAGTIVESGGKVLLDAVNNGEPNLNVQNLDGKIIRARLQTPTDPGLLRSMNGNDTFKVSAVYDLAIPTLRTEDYRIRLTDRGGAEGNNNSPDSLDLRVERRLSDGQVMVRFVRANYVTDQNEVVAQIGLNLAGSPDQIRLNMAKLDPNTHAITASFSYLKDGQVLSTHAFAQTATIFTPGYEQFTRAQFNAQVRSDQLAPTIAARMQTGSPTSLSQTISTGATPFSLSFDYKFESTNGKLDVWINNELIGTVTAPGTLSGAFQTKTILVNNAALANLTNAILKFTLDTDAGVAVMLLDNIVGVALANADFQVGNLTGWTITASGAGGVELAVSEVPLPAALPLFATGLAALGWLAHRRKRRTLQQAIA